MTLTDDDLRAYLNSALAPDKCAALEAALSAGDQDLEARLRALDPLAQDLYDTFSKLPDGERLQRVRALIAAPQTPQPMPKWGAIAAALIVGLGLGWTVQGLTKPTQNPLDWRMQVAHYQALYVPQTVAQTNNPRLQDQFETAEIALGRTFSREALRNLGDLDLVRVQVLGFANNSLIQLAYRAADGTPFALCLMQGSDPIEGAERLAGLESYSWSQDDLRLILIGGENAAFVKKHAELAQALPIS